MTASSPLPLLTIKQTSKALAVSDPMTYKLIRTGALPVVRIGASCRVHPEDLARFIEERRGKRAAE
jgi:excisionase family DNA binding protein